MQLVLNIISHSVCVCSCVSRWLHCARAVTPQGHSHLMKLCVSLWCKCLFTCPAVTPPCIRSIAWPTGCLSACVSGVRHQLGSRRNSSLSSMEAAETAGNKVLLWECDHTRRQSKEEAQEERGGAQAQKTMLSHSLCYCTDITFPSHY